MSYYIWDLKRGPSLETCPIPCDKCFPCRVSYSGHGMHYYSFSVFQASVLGAFGDSVF